MYLRLTRGRFDPARYDEVIAAVPEVVAALRALPGVQDVRVGIDRTTGRTLALTTLDTLAHAQFRREDVGPALARLVTLGWQGEAPELYEATE